MGVRDQGCRIAVVLPASLLLQAFVRRNAWETSWGERKVNVKVVEKLYTCTETTKHLRPVPISHQ